MIILLNNIFNSSANKMFYVKYLTKCYLRDGILKNRGPTALPICACFPPTLGESNICNVESTIMSENKLHV